MLQFKSKNFLTGEELSQVELLSLIKNADDMYKNRELSRGPQPLKGKTIALMFEKPSLRTRVSFTVGIQELGGQAIDLVGSQTKSEEPEDSIRVLQGMVHGLMLRTFKHTTLERMATVAKIPLINGLSDTHHPCQAIADLLTVYQRFGNLQGRTVSYIGDGNNILHSLLLMAPFVGVNVHYSCPENYQPDQEIVKRGLARAALTGASIASFNTPKEAVRGSHAVYTDVWTSMGFEEENKTRLVAFKGYQLNWELFSQAEPDAIALHCLPMVREQEITSEVVEHPRSALFQQAANRLHAQKALLFGLFSEQKTVTQSHARYSHVI